MTKPPINPLIQIYGAVASRYESDIVPAFAQFAKGVVTTAQPHKGQDVLDLGTGTGILARLLAPSVKSVVGIDVVPQMIHHAHVAIQATPPPNLRFQVANADQLPFDDAQFDLVVSAFGMSGTTPSKVLPQLHRVLKPTGVVAFHDWSVMHPIDRAMIQILQAYMLDDDEAPTSLQQLRQLYNAPRPWDNVFQTQDDFVEEFEAYGFQTIQVWEDAPIDCILDLDAFLRYKLAWANRQAELNAMDQWRRGDCLDALRRCLQEQFTDEKGLIRYNPIVFRVRAQAKTLSVNF